MTWLIEIIATVIFRLLVWFLLLPVTWIVSTPVILILSFFLSDTYLDNVKNSYSKVTDFWAQLGHAV
jgi:hypothetical protein